MKPLILHVLPLDLARGAQRYAVALRAALGGDQGTHRHEILTLFTPVDEVLGAEHGLGVPRDGLRRLGFEPRVVPRLRRALSRLRPAMVVAHGSEPLKYLVAAGCRCPVAYYKIGVAHARMSAPLRRRLHAWLLQRADLIVGVSEECVEEVYARFGVDGEHLVIPNGRDPRRFRPRASPRGERPTLIFVGHLSETKRPEIFIEVVRRLREQGVSLDARLVGDGPLRSSLEAPAREAGVELLGKRDDVPELLREADVFLFTSVPEGEGLPGVFIEAGLSGLPIVTTAVPGARTSVLEGQTGFILDPSDIGGLTARTAELLRDDEKRKEFGAQARRHCVAELSLEASVGKWQRVFERWAAEDRADTARTRRWR